MADIVDLPGQVLEERYATQHVGGAFDAKNLPKPKTAEKAAEDARWDKDLTSIYLVGFDSTLYIGQPKVVASKAEPDGSGMPGRYLPATFSPTPPEPFGPLINLPTFIYWDSDPDVWDSPQMVGQAFWDS